MCFVFLYSILCALGETMNDDFEIVLFRRKYGKLPGSKYHRLLRIEFARISSIFFSVCKGIWPLSKSNAHKKFIKFHWMAFRSVIFIFQRHTNVFEMCYVLKIQHAPHTSMSFVKWKLSHSIAVVITFNVMYIAFSIICAHFVFSLQSSFHWILVNSLMLVANSHVSSVKQS